VVAHEGVASEELDVRVGFALGPEGFPVARIRVAGTIFLTCQRCLASVSWPVDVDVALTAVGSDALANELADPFDSVVLDEEGGLALRAAVEDEILAALPIAPWHDAEECGVALEQEQSPRQSRPFAGLAKLMHRSGGDGDEQ